MSEYKKSYLILFNTITDAIKKIDDKEYFEAKLLLTKAQIDAEEAFISFEEGKKSRK